MSTNTSSFNNRQSQQSRFTSNPSNKGDSSQTSLTSTTCRNHRQSSNTSYWEVWSSNSWSSSKPYRCFDQLRNPQEVSAEKIERGSRHDSRLSTTSLTSSSSSFAFSISQCRIQLRWWDLQLVIRPRHSFQTLQRSLYQVRKWSKLETLHLRWRIGTRFES